MRNILISEPNAGADLPYLPYVWAVMKTYFEHHYPSIQSFNWLDPIYTGGSAETMLRPYKGSRIDVLGLSCYIWNWQDQRKLARQAKLDNPDCLVIAGGPEPDYKDPEFFINNPFIDVVVLKDGEIPLSLILQHLANGNRKFQDIPGLVLPANDGQRHIFTAPAQVPKVFDCSPYVSQSEFFESLLESSTAQTSAIMETNRGCPYSCSFCDWGSATQSKLRQFDMNRVTQEIDWLARMQVDNILLADANFGILERDLEITDYINAAREKHGAPKFLYYSSAKNNPDRSIEIAKKFAKSGLAFWHQMSIQHTDPVVLAATDRSNISPQKQMEVGKTLLSSGVPLAIQMIQGIPGDTVDRWKGCMADLMQWGFHDHYQVYLYALLANAPAAEKAFREKWKIRSIERYTCIDHEGGHDPNRPQDLSRKPIVIASSTYSRDDWVQMRTYTYFIKALHNHALTRRISQYLHFSHGVSWKEFYEELIEVFFQKADVLELNSSISAHLQKFLNDKDALEEMPLHNVPSYERLLEPSRWLFFQVCLHLDEAYEDMSTFLLRRYPSVEHLGDVIAYQKNLIMLPENFEAKKTPAHVRRDWKPYFKQIDRLESHETMMEPALLFPTVKPQIIADADLNPQNQSFVDTLHPDELLHWIQAVVNSRESAERKKPIARLPEPTFQEPAPAVPTPLARRAIRKLRRIVAGQW